MTVRGSSGYVAYKEHRGIETPSDRRKELVLRIFEPRRLPIMEESQLRVGSTVVVGTRSDAIIDRDRWLRPKILMNAKPPETVNSSSSYSSELNPFVITC